MSDKKTIVRLAALAAFLTVITTLLLWLLPKFYGDTTSFEDRINLHSDSYYMAKQWVNLFHIPLALIAYFGFAYTLRKRQLPLVSLGMLWFLIWGIVEMIGVSGIIFAVNKTWRANYFQVSEVQQGLINHSINTYFDVWNAWFFVLLVAFLLGTLFFGLASYKGKGLEKIVGLLFLLGVPLTILIMLSGYFNQSWGDSIVEVIYPILQPVSRGLLGVYLLKQTLKNDL